MSHFRKTPPSDWLPRVARQQTRAARSQQGKALPASVQKIDGRIVTVRFEVDCNPALPPLTMPIAESEYVRTPIQPGCKGVAISADVSLEQMAALGSHRPSLMQDTANLGACFFLPLTNAQWDKLDADTLHLYGVAGTEILNRLNGKTALRLLEEQAMLTNGSATISLDGGVTSITSGTIVLNGSVIINGQTYKDHTHKNGNNGAPTGGVIGG